MKHTTVLLSLLFCSVLTFAQNSEEKDPPKGWQLLDMSDDNIPGTSATKALEYASKKRKSGAVPVVVAVIDSGVDIKHEDLKDELWHNEKEVPNNGLDDDNNGFVDDVNGWNFIGGSQVNVSYDTYEVTREVARLDKKYRHMTDEEKAKDGEYDYYKKVKTELEYQQKRYEEMMTRFENLLISFDNLHTLIVAYTGHDDVTIDLLNQIQSPDEKVQTAVENLKKLYAEGITESRVDEIRNYLTTTKKGYDVDFDPRYKVGDDYSNLREVGYGNADVIGSDATHGTHVAGIIAANTDNNIGIKGIAPKAIIMPVRAVPDGDERDKDVANAIRYAADNGAKIINMSFGKSFSPNKEYVWEAIQYAEKKGVLMVHAAGNSGKNTSNHENNYPTGFINGGKICSTWMEIGASTADKDKLVAEFSNYGKESVDTFAPGHRIYSSTPHDKYNTFSGTSMAAPVVAGVAALVWSYYPKIPAADLKDILIKSATPYDNQVPKPGEETKVKLTDISMYGGVVNAYNAMKMARTYYKSHRLK